MPPPPPPPRGGAQGDPYPWPPKHRAGNADGNSRRGGPDGWVKLMLPLAVGAIVTAATVWSDQRTQAATILALQKDNDEMRRVLKELRDIHRVDISDVLKTVNATSVDVAAIKAVVVREPKRRPRRR